MRNQQQGQRERAHGTSRELHEAGNILSVSIRREAETTWREGPQPARRSGGNKCSVGKECSIGNECSVGEWQGPRGDGAHGMLLKQETLRGIENGSITVAFRRWRRPTVKAGGTLLTSVGLLSIEGVEVVSLTAITTSEALAAGFSSLESLRSLLSRRTDGDVYRVRLTMAGPDPRIEGIVQLDSRVIEAGLLAAHEAPGIQHPEVGQSHVDDELIRRHPDPMKGQVQRLPKPARCDPTRKLGTAELGGE